MVHDGGQADVLRDPSQFQVVVAGRRWGKTELAAIKLIRACLTSPGLYRYVAPTAVLARKTIWRRKLRRCIHPDWWKRAPNETRMEYTFYNDSILEVLGAEDPVGLLGEGVNGVVLDEYASMKQDVWTEYVMPSLADTNGWGLFIGSPKSFNHFYDLYELGHNPEFPEWRSWQFRSLQNPLIRPELVERFRGAMDERTFRQEFEASFETVAGRAYYAFHRQHNVRPVVWDPTLQARLWFDFNVSPASAGIGQVQGDRAVVWREVQLTDRGGEATIATAAAVAAELEAINHRGGIAIYGDATGKSAKTTGPSDHAVLRQKFPGATWRIRATNPHSRDRIAAVNAMCHTAAGAHRLEVDPSCQRLIADLEQVILASSGELDKKSNPALTHISDALGYWLAYDFPVRSASYVATVERADSAPVSAAVAAARRRRRAAMAASLEA